MVDLVGARLSHGLWRARRRAAGLWLDDHQPFRSPDAARQGGGVLLAGGERWRVPEPQCGRESRRRAVATMFGCAASVKREQYAADTAGGVGSAVSGRPAYLGRTSLRVGAVRAVRRDSDY